MLPTEFRNRLPSTHATKFAFAMLLTKSNLIFLQRPLHLPVGQDKAGPIGSATALSQVTRAWECSVAALKLPNIGLHTFRHFHASQLIAEGMDPVEISRRLGHASIAVDLGIYGHLIPSKADRAAGIIETAFGSTLRE
jgi:integrase